MISAPIYSLSCWQKPFRSLFWVGMSVLTGVALGAEPGSAQSVNEATGAAERLDLPQQVIDQSPVLQEWSDRTPDIADEILHDPSFPTRLRLGYSYFPSAQTSGFHVGVEDWFVIQDSGLTVSGDYARSFNNQRESYGAEARYYLLPLGEYFNIAPVVGYRHLDTADYVSEGVNLGVRLLLVTSRGGGADIAVSQTWVAPGTQEEVGLTSLSVGYGITQKLRLATDVQFQNSSFGQESRLGMSLEYVP